MNLLERCEPYRAALEERALTIRDLAKILGCSESYLSRTLSPTLNRKESSTESRKKSHLLSEIRALMRKKHALLVKTGQKTLKRAAKDCRCSERTIRRYLEKV
jgi:transcriptional antiterminator